MNEAALAVTHDSQDNVYFTGRGTVDPQGIQMLTLKLDASDGHVVWVDYHGGSAGLDDVAWDIVVGPDDNPVVTGYVVGEGNEAFCLTRKLNKVNGDEIWSRQVPGALDNNAVRSSWLALMDGGDVGPERIDAVRAFAERNTHRLKFANHVKMFADGGLFSGLSQFGPPGPFFRSGLRPRRS